MIKKIIMEFILTVLGFLIVITGIIVYTEDNMSKTIFYGMTWTFLLTIILWFSLTETKDVELQIHEAVSNGESFSYYVDYKNRIIPVPNNAVQVIKIEPRAWSLGEDNYKVIVE